MRFYRIIFVAFIGLPNLLVLPSMAAENEQSEFKEIMDRIQECHWVDSIYEKNDGDPSVYQVKGCQEKKGASNVCAGTMRCRSKFKGSSKSMYFYLENVMCAGQKEICVEPMKCLTDGGMLRSHSLMEIEDPYVRDRIYKAGPRGSTK